MKRITRSHFGPLTRNNSLVPFTLAITALLISGVVVASQLNKDRRIRVESSTDGTLQPGDYRSIFATEQNMHRAYTAKVDFNGRIAESYQENGQPRPIDPSVRAWIAEMSRKKLSSPSPPSPPPPPPPPAPPSVVESNEFKAILRLVAADVNVAAKIGQPISVLPDSIDGHINIYARNNEDGNAILAFDLSGPRGRAKIFVSAALKHGKWTTTGLDVRPKSR